MYNYMYVCVQMKDLYMCIYIYRERERESLFRGLCRHTGARLCHGALGRHTGAQPRHAHGRAPNRKGDIPRLPWRANER